MEDKVRVLRIIEYVGPRKWVEDCVAGSIHGTKNFDKNSTIRGVTIGEFPEILGQVPTDNKQLQKDYP